MSDPRFATLKTDPRFRRLKKNTFKPVQDDRFKSLGETKKKKRAVDKYGRSVALQPVVDYARGAVLMESSDDEDDGDPLHDPSEDGSDSEHDFVALGVEKPDAHVEIDLDENTIAILDAQVSEYAKAVPEQERSADVKQTRRLAVVNLDWDHVRAIHLYTIFSSLLSPTALSALQHGKSNKGRLNVARGRILSVCVYPSEFGKTRLVKEEKEGPPVELFKKKTDEINERTIVETGTEVDYDEDALRKYQLERLRYYYAIVECDTMEAAAHVYNELEGTELERSANVLDLSFVPDDITFDDEPRDEANQPSDAPYRAVEFVTDALRHSKVKLTWDEDDPERTHVLRRPLTKKEIDEAVFRAYIASSSSSEGDSDENGNEPAPKSEVRASKKDRLRKLLLGGNDDGMPEGWSNAFDNKTSRRGNGKTGGVEDSDVDMEVTFLPGLSEIKDPEDENTLERYQRKKKERRKERKAAQKNGEVGKDGVSNQVATRPTFDDEFFGIESNSEHEGPLLVTPDNLPGEPAHFDMKAILQAEKQTKRKTSRHKRGKRNKDTDDGPGETQDDFVIDVKDDRFTAIHEDHQFAIDPTHPQFKGTKSMVALLDERSKRQKSRPRPDHPVHSQSPTQQNDRSLQNLVESVKRKSLAADHSELGKRRKLRKG